MGFVDFMKQIKTSGIVNCPVHPVKDGEEFPTDNCPDCRAFNLKGKVLISGSSGFLGYDMAERLVKNDYEVYGLVRMSVSARREGMLPEGVIPVWGDLGNLDSITRIMQEIKPDYIIHYGALSSVQYSFTHPEEAINTNFLGTVRLAEEARKLPNFRKFLFSSTMEVYGNQPNRIPFTEDMVVHPNCPYAVAKHASEKYLEYLFYAYGFPCVMIRQTNIYGRKKDPFFIVEAIISKMLSNPKEIQLGSKNPVRNFLYVEDLLELEQMLLESDDKRLLGQVFNTGPDNAIGIEHLAIKIAVLLRWTGKIKWEKVEVRPGRGEVWYLNSTPAKIEAILPWKPKTSLWDGLQKTIDIWTKKLTPSLSQ